MQYPAAIPVISDLHNLGFDCHIVAVLNSSAKFYVFSSTCRKRFFVYSLFLGSTEIEFFVIVGGYLAATWWLFTAIDLASGMRV